MEIRLERASFFTERNRHVFDFKIGWTPEGGGARLPVSVENVHGGLEAQWDEAHRVLLNVLEEATAEARRQHEERMVRREARDQPPARLGSLDGDG